MEALDDDCLRLVLEHARLRDTGRVPCVCHRWARLAEDVQSHWAWHLANVRCKDAAEARKLLALLRSPVHTVVVVRRGADLLATEEMDVDDHVGTWVVSDAVHEAVSRDLPRVHHDVYRDAHRVVRLCGAHGRAHDFTFHLRGHDGWWILSCTSEREDTRRLIVIREHDVDGALDQIHRHIEPPPPPRAEPPVSVGCLPRMRWVRRPWRRRVLPGGS